MAQPKKWRSQKWLGLHEGRVSFFRNEGPAVELRSEVWTQAHGCSGQNLQVAKDPEAAITFAKVIVPL
jgi:hypothetical protein